MTDNSQKNQRCCKPNHSRFIQRAPSQERLVSGFWLSFIVLIISITFILHSSRETITRYMESTSALAQQLEKDKADQKARDEETRRLLITVSSQHRHIHAMIRQIDEVLINVSRDVRASRVLVIEFEPKNGEPLFGQAVNWAPNNAINNAERSFNNQHLSLFASMMNNFSQRKCWLANSLDGRDTSHAFWLKRASRSVIACPVRNSELKLLGALVVEYDTSFDESEIFFLETKIVEYALVIGGIRQSASNSWVER